MYHVSSLLDARLLLSKHIPASILHFNTRSHFQFCHQHRISPSIYSFSLLRAHNMPVADPTPDVWTIKFKNARTTVVLHVYQLQTLSSVKVELLHALNSAYPSGELNGMTLPESSDDIELAKPRDFSNLDTGGWQTIEPDAQDDFDADLFGAGGDVTLKGKGKGKAKSRGVGHKDSPLGAGLKDMCAVAFRFKGQKQAPRPVDDDVDEGLGLEDDVLPDADGWNVELPKFEDVYGLNDLLPDDQLTTPKANKIAWDV